MNKILFVQTDIQPDVTHTSAGARRGGAQIADRVQCYAQSEDTGTGTGRWKVRPQPQLKVRTTSIILILFHIFIAHI